MPERFVQIVITRNQDGTFHVTWQNENHVVKSGEFYGLSGYVVETAMKMDIPSQAKRFEQTEARLRSPVGD